VYTVIVFPIGSPEAVIRPWASSCQIGSANVGKDEVPPAATYETVVLRPVIQAVAVAAASQNIHPMTGEDLVVAAASKRSVVTSATVDDVPISTAVDDVVTARAADAVHPAMRTDQIGS
jgi:hypothetical protein